MPAFAPQEHQQGAIQAEDRTRRAARDRLVALQHQRQQVAGDTAAQIEQGKTPAAIQLLHEAADVPQRPHVERQMHDAEVQEHGAAQPPPLAVLGGRPKLAPQFSCTALEVCDQPAPEASIGQEDQHIGGHQQPASPARVAGAACSRSGQAGRLFGSRWDGSRSLGAVVMDACITADHHGAGAGRGFENGDNLRMSTHTPAARPSRLSTQDATRIDDTRIGAVRPLITPALLQEWQPVPPAGAGVGGAAAARRSRVCCTAQMTGWSWWSARAPSTTMRTGHHLRPPAQAAGRRAGTGRSADRHAGVFREAAHHGGLEGLHQRPAPGRQLRDQRGPGDGAPPAARYAGAGSCRSVPSFWICSARSSSRIW
jgi:hypothetical protein